MDGSYLFFHYFLSAKTHGLNDSFTKFGISSYWGILSLPRKKEYAISMVLVQFLFINVFFPPRPFFFLSLLWYRGSETSCYVSFATSAFMLGIYEILPVLEWLREWKTLCVSIISYFQMISWPRIQTRGRWLLYFKSNFHDFGHLLELQSFEERFFLVTPVSFEARAITYDVNVRMERKSVYLFSKY